MDNQYRESQKKLSKAADEHCHRMVSGFVNFESYRKCANAGMITLGELIARLESANKKSKVKVECNGAWYNPGDFSGYRGYYWHIAIENYHNECNVGKLLKKARAAVNAVFTGYKGGDNVMTKMTPVWFSDYGQGSGIGVIGARKEKGLFIIETKLIKGE